MPRNRHARDRRNLPGAQKRPFPEFIAPCLATLRTEAPRGAQWIHELKLDGYRAQAHVRDRKTTIYTRRGFDWTDRFSSIAVSLASTSSRGFVLDGEIVVLNEHGIPDFYRLQEDLAQSRTDRLVYYVYDVLYADGFDLRPCALSDRRTVLTEIVADIDAPKVRLSEQFEADAQEVFRQACALQAEGIVTKDRRAPYRSGRQESWIKLKCTQSDSFPIIAFVEKLGAQPRRIASLYVGRIDQHGRLVYAGKARTGFTETLARDLRERLDPWVRKTSPLAVAIKKPKATWVEPVLAAEVQHSGMTADGLLREAIYKGLRDDIASLNMARKPPKREVAMRRSSARAAKERTQARRERSSLQ